MYEGIAPRDTWTKEYYGPFWVSEVSAILTLPDDRRLTCTTQYVPYDYGAKTGYVFSIIMDGVDRCFVRSSQDEVRVTPTTKCASHYRSTFACCGQDRRGVGVVPQRRQCPKSKPCCENYVRKSFFNPNEQWGTCEPTKCAIDYGLTFLCCGQQGTSTVGHGPQNKCPRSEPTCINYVYKKHWGTCVKKGADIVQVKNDTPYAVTPGPTVGEEGYPYVQFKKDTGWEYTTCTPKIDITEGIAPGDTWTATTRGCMVNYIYVLLTGPDGSKFGCTKYVTGGTTDSLFSILMDGVGGCCLKSSNEIQDHDDTPTTKCAGNYGSNVPCCGQGETGTVSPQYQCPQSKPNCVNYAYKEQWGTCEKVTECTGNYGSNASPQNQCPQSKPKCVNYVANGQWGTCFATCE